MKYLIDFFTDHKGNMSMTRLCTFILVVGGLVYGFVNPEHYTFGIECIVFGLGGKISQKYLEKPKENGRMEER